MTHDEPTADRATDPALRRILARPGGPAALDLLAQELSGADLTSVLLEVMRRRADRLTPAEVMRRYRSDRFVAPSTTDFMALRRAEDALMSVLPERFQLLTLAPLVPLAAHSAVATVDLRKVVATVRGSEVAADPTNALALEAARRRSDALAADPRSTTNVRLAASQRVVRAQHFDGAGMQAHFQIFALVTAGRDTGSRSFEHEHLAEHLRFAAEAISAAGATALEIRLTCLDPAFALVVEQTRQVLAGLQNLAGLPNVEVLDDPDRESGRGYYTGLCYKLQATIADRQLEVGDGGFVDWSQRLTGNRKERLLICGIGVDRLAVS
jgi:hypothetical protein